MRPHRIVMPPPALDDDLGLAGPSIHEALDVAVLPGRARFDVSGLCANSRDPLSNSFGDLLDPLLQSGLVTALAPLPVHLGVCYTARAAEPLKYRLSTMPAETTITTLVDTATLRWRIERDFQDLKQEIGLDHYEGRGWRGFHHHAALSIAAYGFLVAERNPILPSAPIIRALAGKAASNDESTAHEGQPLRPERHTPNQDLRRTC